MQIILRGPCLPCRWSGYMSVFVPEEPMPMHANAKFRSTPRSILIASALCIAPFAACSAGGGDVNGGGVGSGGGNGGDSGVGTSDYGGGGDGGTTGEGGTTPKGD